MAQGIGGVLEIPDNLEGVLDKIDKKLERIAESSEKLQKQFVASMKGSGDSLGQLTTRLDTLNTTINNFDIGKLSNGFNIASNSISNSTIKAEEFADAVVKGIQMLNGANRVSPIDLKSLDMAEDTLEDVNEKLKTYKKLLTENRKGIVDETQVANTKELLSEIKRLQVAYAGLNVEQKAYKQFERSMGMSEANDAKREQKILALTEAQQKLNRYSQKYSNELDIINQKINSLKQLNIDSKINIDNELQKVPKTINEVEVNIDRLKKASKNINLGGDLSNTSKLEQVNKRIQELESTLSKLKKAASSTTQADITKAMGMSEATINQRIAKSKELQRIQKDLDTTTKDGVRSNDMLNSSIRRLNSENSKAVAGSRELQTSHRHLMDTAGQLARRMALVFSVSQIFNFVRKLAEVRGEFELQNVALRSILQNRIEADKLFGQITQLAVESPFRLRELVSYTKQLAAYRVETEKLYDTTKMLADVSAGLGVDMQRLILAYGQVKAANYLRGQELRQFSEAGINILGELSKYFTQLEGQTVSIGEVFERVSKRMVAFGDVEVIFKKLTEEGGIFYNMQERQAQTLAGQLSNLKDSYDIMLNDLGKNTQGLLGGVVSSLKWITENWRIVLPIITAIVGNIILYKTMLAASNYLQGITNGLALIWQKITGKVVKNIEGAAVAQTAFNTASKINPYIAILSTIIAIGATLISILSTTTSLKKELKEIQDNADLEAEQLSRDFKRLANIVLDVNASYKEQSDALKTLQNKYSDMLPLQSLTIDGLREMKGNYDNATAAILRYINIKSKEEALTAIETKFSKKIKGANKIVEDSIIDTYKLSEDTAKKITKQLSEDYMTGRIKDLDDYYNRLAQLINGVSNLQLKADDVRQRVKISGRDNEMYIGISPYLFNVLKERKRVIDDLDNETRKYQTKQVLGWQTEKDEIDKNIASLNELLQIISDLSAKKTLSPIDTSTLAATELQIRSMYSNMGLSAEQAEMAIKVATKGATFIQQAAQDYILESSRKFREKISKDATDEFGKKFIENLSNDINNLSPDKVTEKVNRAINAFIFQHDVVMTGITDIYKKQSETTEEYAQKVKERLESLRKDLEDYKKAPFIADPEKVKQTEVLIKLLEMLATGLNLATGSGSDGKDPEEEKWKNRIELLKKANSEYEKLNKVLSKTEAIDKVNKIMAKEFKSAGMMDRQGVLKYRIDYDRKATLDNIKSLSEEAGAKYAQYFEKEISPMETDLFIDAKLVDVDIVQRELADAFSGYELSVEIDKTGIPKGWIEDMFGVKSINFNGLTKKVNDIIKKARTYKDQLTGKEVYVETEDETIMRVSKEMYGKSEEEKTKRLKEELITRAELEKNLSSENIKLSEDANKKLDDITRKTINDRMKTYEQLINNSRTIEDKITKIERNGEIERMNIREDFGGKNETYMNQLLKASQDTQDKLVADLRDTAFKSTDIYQEMFGDIQSYGDYTINYLINKAKEMTKPFDGSTGVQFIKNERGEDKVSISYRNEKDEIVQTNISMEVYLSLLKQIQNLQNEFGNTSIFKNSIRDWAKYNDLAKERERIEKEFGRNSKEYQRASSNSWNALGKAISSTGDDIMNIISSFQFLSELMGEAGDTALQSMFAVGQAAIAVASAIKTAERSSVIIAIIQAALVTIQAVMSFLGTANERINQQIATLEGELKQLEYWEKRVSKNTFTDVTQLSILKKELELRRQIYKERILNNEKVIKNMSAAMQKNLKEAAYGMYSLATGTYGIVGQSLQLMKGDIESFGKSMLNTLTGGAVGFFSALFNKKAIINAKKALAYANNELVYMKGLSEIIASNFDDMQKSIAALGLSYEKQIANIDAQINAEMSRKAKNINWDKIQDLQDQKFELMQKNLSKWADAIKENFGDIFEELSSNIAQSFMDAFENVTDPAKAFEESWEKAINSMLTNMFKIQYMQPLLKKWMEKFNVAMGLNPDGTAKQDANGKDVIPDMVLTEEEAAELKKQYDAIKDSALGAWQQFSDIFDELGIMAGGEAQMSGLQQGIEGVTEDTAQALEALLNSMRFFVSDSNQVLKNFYNAFTSQDAKVNPILAELKAQTEQIRLINSFLTSIGKSGHPQGGQGIKVFLN